MPDSFLKITWDSFILFLLFINIFYIPLKLSFEDYSSFSVPEFLRLLLEDIPAWAFFIDILLNFNTAVYYHGALMLARTQIA